jgi:hypothetical protein
VQECFEPESCDRGYRDVAFGDGEAGDGGVTEGEDAVIVELLGVVEATFPSLAIGIPNGPDVVRGALGFFPDGEIDFPGRVFVADLFVEG